MKHELTERYIYAVTHLLPLKLRGDVEEELASLISDMLEARCGAVTPEDKDVRIVLTELGAPDALAAKYSGDEGSALISGEYFLLYKFVLKLVLPIAAGGLILANALTMLLEGGLEPTFSGIAMALLRTLWSIVVGVTQGFVVLTIIFAVFERKKVKVNSGDFIDSLPLVPMKNETIRPWEPIAGMVLCVVMALVFLAFPQIMGGWIDGSGWIPALDASVIRAFWLPIALWAVLGIGKEIVRLIEGRYTRRLAIAASVVNPVVAACAVIAFRSGRVMNPVFLARMGEIFGEEGGFLMQLFEKGHLVFLGVVFFALILETVTYWVKAWKYSR